MNAFRCLLKILFAAGAVVAGSVFATAGRADVIGVSFAEQSWLNGKCYVGCVVITSGETTGAVNWTITGATSKQTVIAALSAETAAYSPPAALAGADNAALRQTDNIAVLTRASNEKASEITVTATAVADGSVVKTIVIVLDGQENADGSVAGTVSSGVKLIAPAVAAGDYQRGTKVSYTWKLDGVEIPGTSNKKSITANKKTAAVASAAAGAAAGSATGEGKYTVTVSWTAPDGSQKSLTETFEVDLIAPVKIAKTGGFTAANFVAGGAEPTVLKDAKGKLLANTVLQGEGLAFTVNLEDTGDTGELAWTLFNGKQVVGDPVRKNAKTHTFTVPVVPAKAKYFATVESVKRGTNGKPVYSVKTKTIAPKIYLPPSDAEITTRRNAAGSVVAKVGKPLTLAVKVKGNAKCSYKWYAPSGLIAGGMLITDPKTGLGVNKPSITVKPASSESTVTLGTYRVVITNYAGSAHSTEANVTVVAE